MYPIVLVFRFFIFVDNIRDFTDTLILARQEAEEDPTESNVDKLTDTHLIQTLSDIFFGISFSYIEFILIVLDRAA